jgi:propionyl-CoA carboxylase beta chain
MEKVVKIETGSTPAHSGGDNATATQHSQGKLTARERLELLFDEGSFEELDEVVLQKQCPSDDIQHRELPDSSIIAGSGTVNGRLLFAFSEDITVLVGSLSYADMQKICNLIDRAVSYGAPVVGFYDSCGTRIEEGTAAFAGYAKIAKRCMLASGVVPQISLIMGPCVGAAAYLPSITDFVFTVRDTSHLFVNGPGVVNAVINEIVTEEELGGAVTLASKSGVADLAFDNDVEALLQLRRFLGFLPTNNREDPPKFSCTDPVEREEIALATLVPDDPRKPYDMKELILKIVDENEFFELQPEFAENLIIGLGRLNGSPVGFVANQPMVLAGCLDGDSSRKAARFVRFCDCFNIPIVTFVDIPGFIPGTAQEYGGLAKHGAKLLYAYGEATVSKVSLVTRWAYGGGYSMMGSKHLGGDVNYAWPSAQIAAMKPGAAVKLIFSLETDKARLEMRAEEYANKFASAFHAVSCGYIDEVIEPQTSRYRLCKALERLRRKQSGTPWRKHGNIPL